MSKEVTKSGSSEPTGGSERQFRIREHLWGGAVSALCTFILFLCIAIPLVTDVEKAIIPAVVALLPGFLIGLLLAMIRDIMVNHKATIRVQVEYHKKLEELVQQVDKLSLGERGAQLENASSAIEKADIPELLKKASACVEGPRMLKVAFGVDHAFLPKLISMANEECFAIPNMTRHDFYGLLMDGIDVAGSWKGIHCGTVKLLSAGHLQDVLPHGDTERAIEFFLKLQQAKEERGGKDRGNRFAAARILIVSDNAQEREDLNDEAVMKGFWKTSGQFVPTFWITDAGFRNAIVKHNYGLGDIDRLDINNGMLKGLNFDDGALFDDDICLHYDRRKGLTTIDIKGDGEDELSAKVMSKAFALLDYDIAKKEEATKIFTEIKGPEPIDVPGPKYDNDTIEDGGS